MEVMLRNLNSVHGHGRFDETADYIQHGGTSCMRHTVAVAYYSYMLVKKLGIRCNKDELIRGALLHDYFLYDWHERKLSEGLHGFTHPQTALKNASRDFPLTDREKNIIKRHMFPLTPIPPVTVEGWVVCLVDKACSVYEVFAAEPYEKLIDKLRKNRAGINC